jgi:hypothetical protein
MLMPKPLVLTAAIAALGLSRAARAAEADCAIIDAYAPVPAVATSTDGQPDAVQLASFKSEVIARFPGLYTQGVLNVAPGPAMDRLILRSLASARADPPGPQFVTDLRGDIARGLARFRRLPGFQCGFDIYLADTLGAMDGAGRVVDGRPALVLGVGALQAEQKSISLEVLINHELFHRYHFEAGGFSDDPADRQAIWRALWAEGLATYASKVLTPGATTGEALMLPKDLEARAAPLTPQIAATLLGAADRIDPDVFRTYFTSGNVEVARRGLPWRSGYYIGYLVAERLAHRFSLAQLAHLRGEEAHRLVLETLRQLELDS